MFIGDVTGTKQAGTDRVGDVLVELLPTHPLPCPYSLLGGSQVLVGGERAVLCAETEQKVVCERVGERRRYTVVGPVDV
jgi:hypothetical protein